MWEFSFNSFCRKLKKRAAGLAHEYSNDLDAVEFMPAIESFKYQISSQFGDGGQFKNANPSAISQLILNYFLTAKIDHATHNFNQSVSQLPCVRGDLAN